MPLISERNTSTSSNHPRRRIIFPSLYTRNGITCNTNTQSRSGVLGTTEKASSVKSVLPRQQSILRSSRRISSALDVSFNIKEKDESSERNDPTSSNSSCVENSSSSSRSVRFDPMVEVREILQEKISKEQNAKMWFSTSEMKVFQKEAIGRIYHYHLSVKKIVATKAFYSHPALRADSVGGSEDEYHYHVSKDITSRPRIWFAASSA